MQSWSNCWWITKSWIKKYYYQQQNLVVYSQVYFVCKPTIFNFIRLFNKHLTELMKQIDQLYYYHTFKSAKRIPFYIHKWWYSHKIFQSNNIKQIKHFNQLLLKPSHQQRISNSLKSIIYNSPKPLNFFNFIVFHTERKN